MKIRNIVHKGLKKLFAQGDAKDVPANAVSKLNNMLGFLQDNVEGASDERGSQRNLGPERNTKLAIDIPLRPRRKRNL